MGDIKCDHIFRSHFADNLTVVRHAWHEEEVCRRGGVGKKGGSAKLDKGRGVARRVRWHIDKTCIVGEKWR